MKDKIEKLFDLRKCLDEKLRALDEAATEDAVNEIGKEIQALKDEIKVLEDELYADQEEKPVEEKPVEEKPAEENPMEEVPAEEKPVEEKEEDLVEVKRSFNPLGSFNYRKGEVKMENTKIEERAKALKETNKMVINNEEARSVLVSSGNLATPTEVDGINSNGFAKFSSIVDLVKVVNCVGMGSNRVAYEVTDAAAGTQTEGSAANASDPTFNFVTIQPESVAVLSAISKQAKKQTPLQYESKVRDSAMVALKKKASNVIITKALASTLTNDLTVAAIDATTLRKIAFNYGGSEGIEGEAYLFLNRDDLISFGDVRGTNGNKSAVYEITPDANPNTGVIKDAGLTVRYCINSNLSSGTMLYGNPKNIELDLFSDYEIAVSSDFYFDKLMDAIRGDVELGSDVVAKDGLLKVTVSA